MLCTNAGKCIKTFSLADNAGSHTMRRKAGHWIIHGLDKDLIAWQKSLNFSPWDLRVGA